MKKHFNLLNICLSLFDGGAAGGAGAAAPAGEGAQGDGGAQAGSQALPGRSRRGNKSGGAENVVYGKQPTPPAEDSPAAGGEQTVTQVTELSKEERQAKFRELVSGEYKDLYTEETQRMIDRRFRETKNLEEAMGAHKPILDMLAQRYQIADGDPAKLMTAIEQDDAYWSEAAEEAGMTTEQYKQFQKLQRENESFKAMERQQQSQQAAQQKYAEWMQGAEQVKALYPDFDMASECKNPQFISMLKAGVPVQHAYEVAHLDVIKGGLAQQTAAQTEKKVVDNIRAKGARPAENGVNSNSGISIKSDVSRLSRHDRQEIARRVARGEKIEF